ncbi:HNH endonuclease family protein [Glutamicibacter ardleyensis]|uniref:HNH endonuclease family protein n=1 Tax=Glutamicibacter ardleyensis TaxID=225894 RepID=UPI003FCEE7DB
MRNKNSLKILSALSIAVFALTGCDQLNEAVTEVAVEEAGKAVNEWLNPSEETRDPDEQIVLVNTSDAGKTLDNLSVKGKAPKTGYARSKFGPAWKDIDKNGCDQRNDTLNTDLIDITYKKGTNECVVMTGTFHDPYTGKTIHHVRGKSKIDIDHVVALGQAWVAGAQYLPEEERISIANDPLNLMASDASANRQKGDKEASAWLPPNKAFRCEYISRQIMVKDKYNLSVTKAEKNTMITVLNKCDS